MCIWFVHWIRYDDMVDSVRKLAQLGVQLTVEERNLLSVAYKVRISTLSREQWAVVVGVSLDITPVTSSLQKIVSLL